MAEPKTRPKVGDLRLKTYRSLTGHTLWRVEEYLKGLIFGRWYAVTFIGIKSEEAAFTKVDEIKRRRAAQQGADQVPPGTIKRIG